MVHRLHLLSSKTSLMRRMPFVDVMDTTLMGTPCESSYRALEVLTMGMAVLTLTSFDEEALIAGEVELVALRGDQTFE